MYLTTWAAKIFLLLCKGTSEVSGWMGSGAAATSLLCPLKDRADGAALSCIRYPGHLPYSMKGVLSRDCIFLCSAHRCQR